MGRRPAWYWILCAVVFAGFFTLSIDAARWVRGESDFLQFYSSAVLAGTPDLYSPDAARQIQNRHATAEYPALWQNVRLPFYAAVLRPLAALPFSFAYWLFLTLNAALFGWFVVRFSDSMPDLPLFAAVSLPLVASLKQGQDATLVTAIAATGLLLAARGQDFSAGLVLSLCAIKPHLFVLLPVALVAQKRWRILKGGVAGGALLLGLSFVAGGLGWPAALLRSASGDAASPRPELMLTTHGAASALGLPVAAEWALAAVAAVLGITAIARARCFEGAVAAALIGGTLISYHAYTSDGVLLLLAGALLWPTATKIQRVTLVLSLLPIPYLLLGEPVPQGISIQALLLILLAALAR